MQTETQTETRHEFQTGATTLLALAFAGVIGLSACGGGSGGAPASTPPVVTPPVVVEPPVDPLRPQPSVSTADAAVAFGVAPQDVGGDGGGDGGAGGGAGDGAPIKRARVVITDRAGQERTGQTDDGGNYLIRFPSSFQAPIVVRVIAPNGVVLTSASNESPAANKVLRLNVNPLTDKIVSDAVATTVKGTDKGFNGSGVDASKLASSKADLLASVDAALKASGIARTDQFDPVSSVYTYNGTGVDAVIESITHTRNPATGATELRAKLAALTTDATGALQPVLVSRSTPLGTTLLALPTTPLLTFAKLDAWVNQINRCWAIAAPTDAACSDTQGRYLRAADYLDSSRDWEEDFADVYSNANRAAVAGSTVRNPVVLYTERSVGSTVDDIALVEFTVRQPSTGPLRDNLVGPIEYVKRVTFRRVDNLSTASASNWIAKGNQVSLRAAVGVRYNYYVQNNPEMDGPATFQAPSQIQTSIVLNLNRTKFDPITRQYVDSNIRAARLRGPGLPDAGIVFGLSPTFGQLGLAIHNKTGTVPAGTLTAVSSTNGFRLGASLLDGSAMPSSAWPSTSITRRDQPLTDFSSLRALSSYSVEVFLHASVNPSVPDVTFTSRILSEAADPALIAKIPQHDWSPSKALVTAPAKAIAPESVVTVTWANNRLVAPAFEARLFATSFNELGNQESVDYRKAVPNARNPLANDSSAAITVLRGIGELRTYDSATYRELQLLSSAGRAELYNILGWSNLSASPAMRMSTAQTGAVPTLVNGTFTVPTSITLPTGQALTWRSTEWSSGFYDGSFQVQESVIAATGTTVLNFGVTDGAGRLARFKGVLSNGQQVELNFRRPYSGLWSQQAYRVNTASALGLTVNDAVLVYPVGVPTLRLRVNSSTPAGQLVHARVRNERVLGQTYTFAPITAQVSAALDPFGLRTVDIPLRAAGIAANSRVFLCATAAQAASQGAGFFGSGVAGCTDFYFPRTFGRLDRVGIAVPQLDILSATVGTETQTVFSDSTPQTSSTLTIGPLIRASLRISAPVFTYQQRVEFAASPNGPWYAPIFYTEGGESSISDPVSPIVANTYNLAVDLGGGTTGIPRWLPGPGNYHVRLCYGARTILRHFDIPECGPASSQTITVPALFLSTTATPPMLNSVGVKLVESR